uniref:Uncharacterized protein n=1 Tax=Setaria viridis TaxID=4556 RepID=A0A4U6ULS8_SETVI|nr:hypothetical protein SEVIR_5G350133v2 [Setaria viridis]
MGERRPETEHTGARKGRFGGDGRERRDARRRRSRSPRRRGPRRRRRGRGSHEGGARRIAGRKGGLF